MPFQSATTLDTLINDRQYNIMLQTGHTSHAPQHRNLNVYQAIAVSVGMVMGSGIFRAASSVAANVSTSAELFLVWSVGGLLSFIGALCYAELATAFPNTGGDYYFLRKSFGPVVGFMFAWSRFTVIYAGSLAALAFTFGDYLNQAFHLGQVGSAALPFLIILALTGVNLRGIKSSAGTQVGLTAIDIGGLLSVGLAGIWLALHTNISTSTHELDVSNGHIGVAMVGVLFAFGGWSDVATLSAEVRDGKRGMVKTMLGALAIITVLYVGVNWAYWRGLGLSGLAHSTAPAADVMRLAFGKSGEFIIVAVIAISTTAAMNATIIVGGRTTYAAGRDWPALRRLADWDEARGTPKAAIWAQSSMALLLICFGLIKHNGFEQMLDYLSPVFWFFLTLSGLAVIVLRYKFPDQARPYKVPLYPLMPLLFSASSAYVLYSSVIYLQAAALAGLAMLALGAVLAYVLKRG